MSPDHPIKRWLAQAPTGSTHLIVVCDTFSYENYPVWAYSDKECLEKYSHYSQNMQKVMEVYDLRLPLEPQIKVDRILNLPK